MSHDVVGKGEPKKLCKLCWLKMHKRLSRRKKNYARGGEGSWRRQRRFAMLSESECEWVEWERERERESITLYLLHKCIMTTSTYLTTTWKLLQNYSWVPGGSSGAEEDFWWKMTFLTKDDLWREMTFDGRWPLTTSTYHTATWKLPHDYFGTTSPLVNNYFESEGEAHRHTDIQTYIEDIHTQTSKMHRHRCQTCIDIGHREIDL